MRTRFSYPAIHSLYPQYGTPCYIFPESVPPGFSTDVYGLQYHIRFEQSFLLYPDLKVILLLCFRDLENHKNIYFLHL